MTCTTCTSCTSHSGLFFYVSQFIPTISRFISDIVNEAEGAKTEQVGNPCSWEIQCGLHSTL